MSDDESQITVDANRLAAIIVLWEQCTADREALAALLSSTQAELASEAARTEAVKQERDGLHATLKAVVDYAIDVVGMPARAMLGPDAPFVVMQKLYEDLTHCRTERDVFGSDNLRDQRDSAIQRATSAERLALERYDEIEELRASMGEPAQRYVTAVEQLRKERDQAAAAERERIAAWLDGVADASATNIKAAFAATWATAIRAQGKET